MIGYHLRLALGPRHLLVPLPAAWFTWIGFQPGGAGTEVGASFGPWGLARYWAIIAALLAAAVVPLIGRAWQESRLRAGWRLASASPAAMASDRFRVFLAGYAVYAVGVAAGMTFAGWQLSGHDRWLPALAIVTVAGPLLGGYTLLACCYAVHARWGSAASISLALTMAILDLANAVPLAALSVSGTGDVARLASSWSLTFEEADFTVLPWPAPAFLLARLTCAITATVLVLATRGAMHLDPDTARRTRGQAAPVAP